MMDAKHAAVEQWSSDPCGPDTEAPVGSRAYFEQLDAGRGKYAPWMDRALDYAGSAGLNVLDVGCGQGIDLARYARRGARVTGVDLTPRHVELACQHLAALDLKGEVLRGDAEALPFQDDHFDRVSSNGVLHHTPDIHAALLEVRRVLRPGGQATIIVYNRASLHYWLGQVLQQGLLRGYLLRERSMAGVLSRNVECSSIAARPLVRVYSPREMRALMRAAGFREVNTEVAHLWPTDMPLTRRLADHQKLFDALGRHFGWYVIARGAA
jgi:ubiquinone/menaquinone biosynthesis C-methylase UbiE